MNLAEEIINGNHDADLDQIVEAIRQRRKLNRSKDTALTMATVNVGDVVVLKGLTPKYLNGNQGKVVGKRRTKIEVQMDQAIGRYGRMVTVPATCIDKV